MKRLIANGGTVGLFGFSTASEKKGKRMNAKFLIRLAVVVSLSVVPVYAVQIVNYGWEDGVGTILGSFGNLVNPTNVDTTVYGGFRALRVTESPHSGTPQAYLAFVTNLNNLDIINASFYGYDVTPTPNAPSLRIWAHYATSDNINDFQGSADGNLTYTSGAGWEQLSYSWVFDSLGDTRDALVIEARLYSTPAIDPAGSTDFFIDDLSVTAPDTATIHVAPEPATLVMLGLGSIVLLRRRKA